MGEDCVRRFIAIEDFELKRLSCCVEEAHGECKARITHASLQKKRRAVQQLRALFGFGLYPMVGERAGELKRSDRQVVRSGLQGA